MIRKYKYLLFLVPVLLGACTQDVTESMHSQVTIKAQIVEPQTRTAMSTLDDDNKTYHVLWSEGEEIVVGKTGEFQTLTLTSGAGTQTAQFTGNEPTEVYGDCFAAVYPVQNAVAGTDDDYIYVGSVLNASQTYVAGTFSKDLAPMTAVSTDGLIYHFHNLYSVIQLPIKGTGTLRKLELTGNNNEKVAGGIRMNYSKTNGEPVASSVASDNGCMITQVNPLQDKITLTFGEDGLTLNETTPVMVNVVVLPGTFTGGFKISIWDKANDEVYEKETTELVTVKRSYVKRMKEFDYKTAEPLEPLSLSVQVDPMDNGGTFDLDLDE